MAIDPTPGGQILIYRDGDTRLQVRLEGRTVWLSQRLIAELFQVSVKTVNEHLVNIYDDGELDRGATVRSFRIVQLEGSREVARAVEHYSLEAILAAGYRVRSARGTAFRQPFNLSDWGGECLREDKRWQYGGPPAGNANFTWVQHISRAPRCFSKTNESNQDWT